MDEFSEVSSLPRLLRLQHFHGLVDLFHLLEAFIAVVIAYVVHLTDLVLQIE